MKNYYMLLGLVLMFSSCEKLKDLTDVKFETEFEADIPVVFVQTAKGDIGASNDAVGFPFNGTYTVRLDSDDEIAKYIDLVKSVQLKGYTMKPVGLSAENSIYSLVIMVNDKEMFNETDIKSDSEYDESSISQVAIDEFTSALKEDKKVDLTISGSAAMPAFFTISQLFSTEIVANPL